MGNIEHWALVICGNCRQRRTFGLDSPKCANCGMREWREVEVVPASHLRGAVAALAEAYECLTDADTLGPDVTVTAVEAARMVLASHIVAGGQS